MNVKEELRSRLDLAPGLPLLFDVDAWSFARGEAWQGAARDHGRAIVFTLGTGLGSAFVVDGVVIDEGPGVPWLGWVAGRPYRDGIVNDYVSRTFMIERYRGLTGQELDVADIAARAHQGEAAAIRVFAEVAGRYPRQRDSGAARDPLQSGVSGVRWTDLQIVRPVPAGPRAAASGRGQLTAILPAADIELSALRGAARLVFGDDAVAG